VGDQRKDEQPKLEKLIAEMRAREAPTRLWLERNWTWMVVILSGVMGFLVGRLW
jgi:hypothetical protein